MELVKVWLLPTFPKMYLPSLICMGSVLRSVITSSILTSLYLYQVTLTDNSVQEARIHSNDLSNVATAAAALNTHINSLTCNNSHNNITNTNIQAATAAANAAVAAATQSGTELEIRFLEYIDLK